MNEGVVVIGAGGGIGQALVAHWLATGGGPVIAVSRHPSGVMIPACIGCVAITAISRWLTWWPVSPLWPRDRTGW